MNKYYAIKNIETSDWWSNEFGWTEFLESAAIFKSTKYSLPINGEWVELESGLNLPKE